jgi:hypothetical protein
MFDTATKKLIWRGSTMDTLAANPREDTDKLNKAVHKMFEHFLPNRNDGMGLLGPGNKSTLYGRRF